MPPSLIGDIHGVNSVGNTNSYTSRMLYQVNSAPHKALSDTLRLGKDRHIGAALEEVKRRLAAPRCYILHFTII
jgi:hypothetical protein